MPSKPAVALAACAAAASAATLLASAGSAADAARPPLTLTATFDRRSLHTTDAAPKGPSAGDVTVYSATLRRRGRIVGRLQGSTTAADPRYRGDVKTQYLTLSDGTIAIVGGGQNGAPGTVPRGTPIPDAIIGGTGRYAGAAGSVSGRDIDDTRMRMTLRFTR